MKSFALFIGRFWTEKVSATKQLRVRDHLHVGLRFTVDSPATRTESDVMYTTYHYQTTQVATTDDRAV
jgi:hypothetical protein